MRLLGVGHHQQVRLALLRPQRVEVDVRVKGHQRHARPGAACSSPGRIISYVEPISCLAPQGCPGIALVKSCAKHAWAPPASLKHSIGCPGCAVNVLPAHCPTRSTSRSVLELPAGCLTAAVRPSACGAAHQQLAWMPHQRTVLGCCSGSLRAGVSGSGLSKPKPVATIGTQRLSSNLLGPWPQQQGAAFDATQAFCHGRAGCSSQAAQALGSTAQRKHAPTLSLCGHLEPDHCTLCRAPSAPAVGSAWRQLHVGLEISLQGRNAVHPHC